MAFKEVRLNIYISYDSQSGPSYKTSVIELPSGAEQRIGWWTTGRKQWKIKKELLSRADILELETFFRTMKGKLHGFRLRDWLSYKQVDAPMGVIDNTHGQMQFLYSESVTSSTEIQKVTKPVLAADVENDSTQFDYSPDITLKRDGSPWTSGGNWTIDRNTGIITYASSQNGHTITWSGSYDWPVRFDSDEAMFHREGLDIHDWSDISMIELKQ